MKALIVFATLFLCTMATSQACEGLKAFGAAYTGEQCSADLFGGCDWADQAFDELQRLLSWNFDSLFLIYYYITSAITSAESSFTTCEYVAHIKYFFSNFWSLYKVIYNNFSTLHSDALCFVTYLKTDCAKAGKCAGEFLHLLSTKA